MAVCEKCWREAARRWGCNPHKSQTEYYLEVLQEKENNHCSPEEQKAPAVTRREES